MRLSFETCVNMPMSYEKYAHKRSQGHVCICICTHFDIQHAYGIVGGFIDFVILCFLCIQRDDDPNSCMTSIFWGFFGSIEGHGDSRHPQIHWSTASRWCPLKDEIGPRIFNFDPFQSRSFRWTSPIAYIRLKPLDVPDFFPTFLDTFLEFLPSLESFAIFQHRFFYPTSRCFSQELFSDADVVVESASELDFTKAGIIQSSGARNG